MWPHAILKSSCMWYEQEIETDETVLQILYTDFFPFMQLFFFLKKVQHVKPKMHNTFKKILTKFSGPPSHLFTSPVYTMC